MPIEVKGPDGSIVRFPDDTTDDVITKAMRDAFGGPSEAATAAPETPAPAPKKQAEVRAYEPTIREKVAQFFMGDSKPSPERERLVKGVMGTSGLPGSEQIGAVDFTPARIPLFAQEAKRDIDAGNYGGAAMDALGATPIPLLNKGVDAVVAGANKIGNTVRAATPRDRLIEAAARQGVEVPRGAVNDTWSDYAGTLADTPFIGTPLKRAAERGVGQTEAAIERTMAGYGRTSARESGETATDTIQEWIRHGSVNDMGVPYSGVNQAMPDTFTRPLTATQAAANDIIAGMQRSTSTMNEPAVRVVERAIATPGGLTFQGLRDLRTDIGARIADPDPAAGTVKPALRRLYGAMTEDMRAMVNQIGGRNLVGEFDRAEAAARDINAKREELRKIIGSTPNSSAGESVVDALVRRAGSTSTADTSSLAHARSVMSPQQWNEVAGEAIHRLGRDTANEFNPAIFRRKYTALSEQGKEIMFGPTSSVLRRSLDDIAEFAPAFVNMARQANHSGTARMLLGSGMIASGGIAGLVNPAFLVTALKGGVAMNLAARYLARPAVAKTSAGYMKAALAAMKTPSERTQLALMNATQELVRQISDASGESEEEVVKRITAASPQTEPRANLIEAMAKQGQGMTPQGGDPRQRLLNTMQERAI